MKKIAIIPGDGIGKEVMDAALRVIDSLGMDFEMVTLDAGDDALKEHGTALPEETLDKAKKSDAVLFGAAGETAAGVIIKLRQALKTYVNLRPAKSYPGVKCLYPDVDLVIVRENSECMYKGIEFEPEAGMSVAMRVITEKASKRIAEFAFKYARDNGRRKVSCIHKANVMKKTCGLFRDSCREVAKKYQDIEYDEYYVDAAAMFLVLDPKRFDVIVTTNLFGDILSDEAAGLVGGLGLLPSANIGDENAIFEPVHGSAPDIAGKGIANPSAMILSAAMMLEYLGYRDEAGQIEKALEHVLLEGKVTPDLGGNLSTMGMAEEIVRELHST
jgi:3-isopropylmalate dehydrogenase